MMRCSSSLSAASAMARAVVVMARVVGAMARVLGPRSSAARSLGEGGTRPPSTCRKMIRYDIIYLII
eukprot:scaffold5607_cov58-Phaeocystis_antarctica.AAC.2